MIIGPITHQKFGNLVESIWDEIAPPVNFALGKIRLRDAIPFAYIGATCDSNKLNRAKQHLILLKKREQKKGPYTAFDIMNNPRYSLSVDNVIFKYQTSPLQTEALQKAEIKKVEKELISYFKKKSVNIVNIAPGGEGMTGKSPYYIYIITSNWINY